LKLNNKIQQPKSSACYLIVLLQITTQKYLKRPIFQENSVTYDENNQVSNIYENFPQKYRVIEKSIIFQKIDLQGKLVLFIENFNIQEI
jgi:hypothetical protein